LLACNFIVWDHQYAYNLNSSIDKEYSKTGASSFLVHEAIRFASTKTKGFNFCGSMLENVEQSFRRFGAKQQPYFQVYKLNSMMLRIWFMISGKDYFI